MLLPVPEVYVSEFASQAQIQKRCKIIDRHSADYIKVRFLPSFYAW